MPVVWLCVFSAFGFFFFFFFNDTATTEIYTLSLHDALPIRRRRTCAARSPAPPRAGTSTARSPSPDRKSTRLNSSHLVTSYAFFCLKKKKHLTLSRSLPKRAHPNIHCLNETRSH